jgi:hypothetical protein
MNFKEALDRLMIFGFSIGTPGLLLILAVYATSVPTIIGQGRPSAHIWFIVPYLFQAE